MSGGLRVLGAGGHGKVAADAWASSDGEIIGFHDDAAGKRSAHVGRWRVLGALADAVNGEDGLHVAVGNNQVRKRIASGLPDARFPAVIHAAAIISPEARIGAGTLVCAGAIVQSGAVLGRHVIVNSTALVEHDCRIGDFVHIAPGVRLAGEVSVGEAALIGIGAIVLPGIAVGAGAVVGAGSVVIADVPAGAVVAGNPARPLR